jgi:dihydrofolate reductase
MKAPVYLGTSLDGFIARHHGAIDWLVEAEKLVPEGEDCGYKAFMDSVDTLVMGRKSFEQVLTFGPWHHRDTPVIVRSRNPLDIPDHSGILGDSVRKILVRNMRIDAA